MIDSQNIAPSNTLLVGYNNVDLITYSQPLGRIETNRKGFIKITCTTHDFVLKIKGKIPPEGEAEALIAGGSPFDRRVYCAHKNEKLRVFVNEDDVNAEGEWEYQLIFLKDDNSVYVSPDPRIIVRAA
jgi:hypothetical protein